MTKQKNTQTSSQTFTFMIFVGSGIMRRTVTYEYPQPGIHSQQNPLRNMMVNKTKRAPRNKSRYFYHVLYRDLLFVIPYHGYRRLFKC